MKNFFKNKDEKKEPCDPILDDLKRGQEGRKHADNYMPREYFEDPEVLAQVGFEDNAGYNFLGIVGGKTEQIEYRSFKNLNKTQWSSIRNDGFPSKYDGSFLKRLHLDF